jgi:AcrR family transcriptional regulator
MMGIPASAEPIERSRKRGRPRHAEPSPEYRQRLESIISVAASVFHTNGYDAGSLDDVAAALGLTKASLYYYVRGKSDLLRLVFERAIDAAVEDVDRLAETGDPEERLVALIRYQAELVTRDPALYAVFFGRRSALEPAVQADLGAKERRYVGHFIHAVEEAIAAGLLAPGDPRMVANAILGMTSWSFKWFDPKRDSPEKFADCCVAMVLGGGRSRAGFTRRVKGNQ